MSKELNDLVGDIGLVAGVANVAVSLAKYSIPVQLVTRILKTDMGNCAVLRP